MQTITAIATAFHPDGRLAAVVDAALESCTEVIVVDNTPAGQSSAAEALAAPRVRVLRGGHNVGLAAALNIGIRALSPETEAVLFLDQDSVLTPDLVAGLAAHLAEDVSVAVAAPAPWDAEQGRYYEPGAARQPEVADRDAVITSGMLVRRAVLDQVGQFREEFFVDHVDNDFCLRVRRTGGRIVRDRRLKLAHSLGQRNQHKLPGVTLASSRHPTWRLYWIARNGTILVREHRRHAPRWSLGTGVYLVRWFLLRTLIEAPRGPRAAAMLRGFRDGLTGRVDLSRLPEGAEHPERTA